MSLPNLYSSVVQYKHELLIRGYDEDGQRTMKIEKIEPYLFINSRSPESPYKNIHGIPVERVDFNSTYDARDFINRYKDVSGYPLYGMHQWVYPYIHDNYVNSDGHIDWARERINTALIDIETDTGIYDDHMEIKVRKTERHEEIHTTVEKLGEWVEYEVYDISRQNWVPVRTSSYVTVIDYGDVQEANKEINAITIHCHGTFHVFGMYEWEPEDSDVVYYKASNEREMLLKFAEILKLLDPDVISGWNSEGYDIPYITNRFNVIFGEGGAGRLSPWGLVDTRTFTNDKGREEMHAAWQGINGIDYMDLYRKFESASEESYKLDFISTKVLGVGKIDYEEEYGSLRALYILNRKLYYDYNLVDVRRLVQMEEKLKLFDIMISLAYYMKVNFNDVFGTVRPWDAFIHSYLMRQGIVVPYMRPGEEGDSIAGGFVKKPHPRKYRWPVSFDVKSLYPSLARQCNISPETIITTIDGVGPDAILRKALDPIILQQIKEENTSLCATGCVFDNSVEGFIAACMRLTYEERTRFQGLKKAAAKELKALEAKLKQSESLSEAEVAQLKKDIKAKDGLVSYYNAQQMSRKLALNSLYGSLANRFNRWFDNRLAESITLTGQTAIQFVAMYINKFLNMYCKTEDVDYVIYIDTDSVPGDSIIRTDLGDLKIEDVFNTAAANGTYKRNLRDNFVVEPHMSIHTPSVNRDGQIETKRIKYVMKHKVKKTMYKVKVDGKEVIVTADHSLMVKRDGQILDIKAADIQKGDKLITIKRKG